MFADEHADGLEELEWTTFDWPVDTSNPPTSYPCNASGFSKAATLETFGQAVEENGRILVRTALFPTNRPERGHTIAYNGRQYRINEVFPLPGDKSMRLICVNASRGA